METQSRIVLTRSSEWMNRARSFKVLINGQQTGTIGNGASESFAVSPGSHKVSCKVDWCSSREFDINLQPGETAYLRVQSGMKYYWQFVLPMIIVLFINAYLIFTGKERPFWFNILIGLTCLPGAGYILYYTAINRKEYLLLKYDDKSLFVK
jgi:hypothetical protein